MCTRVERPVWGGKRYTRHPCCLVFRRGAHRNAPIYAAKHDWSAEFDSSSISHRNESATQTSSALHILNLSAHLKTEPAQACSELLTATALRKGSMDNTSAMVVDLRRLWEAEEPSLTRGGSAGGSRGQPHASGSSSSLATRDGGNGGAVLGGGGSERSRPRQQTSVGAWTSTVCKNCMLR